MLDARSKRGKGNDLDFQFRGDMWLFPSSEVVRVYWFSVGWLMLIG